MKRIALVAVTVLAAGSAFADLSITRECDADEGRGKDGFFVVSRGTDDSVTKPIRFVFSVGGTARPGWTYCSLWGDETIPAGDRSVRIRIIPLDDPETKEDATVTLTLQPSSGAYTVDPAKAAATLRVLNGATFGGYNRRDAGPWNFIAHMGAGEGKASANSREAVTAAARDGFSFENDLQVTSDGRFYVSHDKLKDITGRMNFKESLALVKPGILYKVDCKCCKFGENGLDFVIKELKETDAVKRGGRLAFNIPRPDDCRRLLREVPGVEAWMGMGRDLKRKYDIDKEAARIIAAVKSVGGTGYSIGWDERLCTKEFFDKLNAASIDIDVWTIDDVRTAKKAINNGARWVTTNAPRRLANELPPANPL